MTRSRLSATLFLLALIVRIASLLFRHEYLPPPPPAIIGAEAGAIANHLVAGHGFATPFDLSPAASPSTHLPPLFPFFLAALLFLFHSPLPGFYLVLLINLLATAALPVIALRIADAARFPPRVGLLAAILLCFCPESLRAAGLIWDEALLTFFAAFILLWIIKTLMRDPPAPSNHLRSSTFLGVANGLLALLNPAMCIALPAAWLAGLHARGTPLRKLPLHALLLAAMTLLASSPWHLRNWLLLHPPAPVFIRGNFWLEVWSSMHPVTPLTFPDGKLHMIPVHPWNGSESLQRIDVHPPQHLTEQQYFAWCKQRVFAAFRDQPRLLLHQVAEQFNAFWLGIAEARRWLRNPWLFFLAQGLPAIAGILGLFAARKKIPPIPLAALATLLILFPLPYYLTGGAARYRHPIDLPLYLGAAWLIYLLIAIFRKRTPGTLSSLL
jgi:hypothetical protein